MEIVRPTPAPERIGQYASLTRLAVTPFGPLDLASVATGSEQGRIVTLHTVVIPKSEKHARERVLEAGLAAKNVRHSQLLAVLDVMPRELDVVMVCEYVEAASVRTLLRRAAAARAPLPPSVALAIATDLVRALAAGTVEWRKSNPRAAASIHGGLVPDSVLVASFGETMLADLGLAAAVVEHSRLRSHLDVLPYRAPECLATPAAKPDERADVYSVGVLLWEMLANRPLFGHADRFVRPASLSPAEIIRQVTTGNVPRLDLLPKKATPIPPMLIEIVHQLLSKQKSARFSTLSALLETLEKLAGDLAAAPEQIAVTVSRLAQNELEEQRTGLERVAASERVSASPPSARSTARPPRRSGPPRPGGIEHRFPVDEAPTLRRRAVGGDVQLPARALTPPRVPRFAPEVHAVPVESKVVAVAEVSAAPLPSTEPTAAPAMFALPDPAPEVQPPLLAPPPLEAPAPIEAFSAPQDQEPSSIPDATVLPPVQGPDPRRKLRVAVAVGVILMGVLTVLTVALMRSPERPSPTPEVASRTRTAESTKAGEAEPPTPTPSPSADETDETDPVPATSPKPTIERGPDRAPGPAPERPGGKKPYRPRGI